MFSTYYNARDEILGKYTWSVHRLEYFLLSHHTNKPKNFLDNLKEILNIQYYNKIHMMKSRVKFDEATGVPDYTLM